MLKPFVLLSMIFLVSIALTVSAEAVPVQWTVGSGGNGHYYEKIGVSINWPNARTAAASLSYLGIPGHLATITSAQENSFLINTVGGGSGWLGGYQDLAAPDYSEPSGGWRWVTGEIWAYTNWFPGPPQEPNNQGNENILENHVLNLGWNDLSTGQLRNAYFVEYSIDEIVAAVIPEPSTFAFLSLGLIALCKRRRGA